MTVIFAQLSVIYVIACVIYLIVVKMCNIGTPFYDTLTDTQKKVKKESVAVRARIFLIGILFGLTGVTIWNILPPHKIIA